MSRLVVFGIDGASLDFLEKLADRGSIPNIKRLLDSSAVAPLKPVIPLNSASVWTSIITGLNPDRHGIFGFMKKSPGGTELKPNALIDLDVPTIWDAANAQGARVGLINYPLTYPPVEFDGFMVSGILVPHNELFATPESLKDALDRQFGHYLVDVSWAGTFERPNERDAFLNELYRMCRKREDAILYCMKNLEWDILFTVFTGTDRLMHSFWHFTDERHPLYNKTAATRYGMEIEKYYTLVDGIIGNALSLLDEKQDSVALVSDHGFGPCYRNFHLATWLEKHGYLAVKEQVSGSFYENLDAVDWAGTKAYPAPVSDQGIYLNLEGREPDWTVSRVEAAELTNKLKAELGGLCHEGHNVLGSIITREAEKVSGDCSSPSHAADLYLVARSEIDIDDKFSKEDPQGQLLEVPKIGSGMHFGDGLFSIKSPNTINQVFDQGLVNAADVMPTLLTVLELKVPRGLDGNARVELFREKMKESVKYLESDPPLKGRRKTDTEDKQDEAALKRHLKGLGYL